jgi:hypothetical protein
MRYYFLCFEFKSPWASRPAVLRKKMGRDAIATQHTEMKGWGAKDLHEMQRNNQRPANCT